MSIIDSRADRRLASERIDRCKVSIADLQSDIDAIFRQRAMNGLSAQSMIHLAEIDTHLSRALIELGEAQRRILTIGLTGQEGR